MSWSSSDQQEQKQRNNQDFPSLSSPSLMNDQKKGGNLMSTFTFLPFKTFLSHKNINNTQKYIVSPNVHILICLPSYYIPSKNTLRQMNTKKVIAFQ